MRTLDALAREVGSVGKTLHKLDADEWEAPTRCAPMTVKQLVGHVGRGGLRITEMLAQEPVGDEPEKDGVTYFQYDAALVGPDVVRRAREASDDVTPAELVRSWDESWSRALRAAREILSTSDPVLPGIFGTIRLSEYIRTRIVEVTVHHLDFDDALGHPPHPDPGALEATGDVLRGLLGTDLRPVGMDDLRFAYTGTGRASLTDAERGYLGPLADTFPLFS